MKILNQINKVLLYYKKTSRIDLFKNILVVSNTGLGDTILSTPSIVSLRKSFPKINITFLVDKKMFPLFEEFEYVDDFLLYSSGLISQLKIVRELRKREIDTIFLFHSNGPEDIFFSILSGARNILKMTDKTNHDFQTLFCNTPNLESKHDIEKKLDLVRVFNPSIIEKKMMISNSAQCKNVLFKKNYDLKYIGMQMGAKDSYKIWPLDNFIGLADKLNSKFNNLRFVLLGSSNHERSMAEKFEKSIIDKNSVINLCGKSKVNDLPCLINDLDILLTNDTGTLHLSIALGKDSISLFGPTNPDEFGPYQDLHKHTVIRTGKSNFVKDREINFKNINKMDNISIDKVNKVMDEWIQN